jgi:hypothetical protein
MLILVFTRMLWKDGLTDGRKDGGKDGSVTISLRNFVGDGIIKGYVERSMI